MKPILVHTEAWKVSFVFLSGIICVIFPLSDCPIIVYMSHFPNRDECYDKDAVLRGEQGHCQVGKAMYLGEASPTPPHKTLQEQLIKGKTL